MVQTYAILDLFCRVLVVIPRKLMAHALLNHPPSFFSLSVLGGDFFHDMVQFLLHTTDKYTSFPVWMTWTRNATMKYALRKLAGPIYLLTVVSLLFVPIVQIRAVLAGLPKPFGFCFVAMTAARGVSRTRGAYNPRREVP